MKFEKLILLVLAMLYVLGMISELFFPGTKVFEACKNIIPPMSTFIIGYYFAKSS